MAPSPVHRRFAFVPSFALLVPALIHAAFLHGCCTARPTLDRALIRWQRRHIDAIYNFGDSISDTGNLLHEQGPGDLCGNLPYGETLGVSTGRCSDGRLMIDYLAEFLNLPYLPPYLDKSANFDHGANFAVGGSTALDPSLLLDRGINATATNSSLSVQLQWFKTHLLSSCASNEECEEGRLGRALFLVGAIGGNDYNYGLWQHKTIEEMKALVPLVVGRIVDAVEELINLGAVHLIVPGNFPIGCFPCYLTLPKGAFDLYQEDCIEGFNEFARLHNDRLQDALRHQRKDHPRITIEYADYYDAFLALLQGADGYGFNKSSLFKACCGIGGANNYDPRHMCGTPGVPVCPDPAKFMSWDGVHLTQAAYKAMATQLFAAYFLGGKHVAR